MGLTYSSRTVVGLAAFVLTSYLNALSAVLAGWRTPNIQVLLLDSTLAPHRALPDLGHDMAETIWAILPFSFRNDMSMIDFNGMFLNLFGYPLLVFSFLHPLRHMIVRRTSFVYSWINVFRAVCIVVTSMPDASRECQAQFGTPLGAYKSTSRLPRAFGRAFKVMLDPSKNVTCGDMIFSGHTVLLVLVMLLFHKYFRPEMCVSPFVRQMERWTGGWFLPFLRWWHYIGCSAGIVAIIATRLHYSIDVVLAIAITCAGWWIFHAFAEIDEFRKSNILIHWWESDETIAMDRKIFTKCKSE